MIAPKLKPAAIAAALLGVMGLPPASAGLVVTPETSPTALLSSLISGSGFTLSNATLTGNIATGSEQQGSFSGGVSAGIGLESGVLLTSGRAVNAVGPNTLPNITSPAGGGGDAQLSALVGTPTLDANVLSVTFTPSAAGTLQFRYVFASEEYNAIAEGGTPTPFDDVFGLFVNGVNHALVPGFNRVSILTVNCGAAQRGTPPTPVGPNCGLFVNNDFDASAAPYDLQYDGFTQVLTANLSVAAGTPYQVQLAIADVSEDRLLDSGAFIAAQFRADDGGNGVPEPGTLALLGLGLAGLAATRRRK